MIVKSGNLTHLYKDWQAQATPAQIKFVDDVFDLCERNYEAGGDTIVECYGPKDILAEFTSMYDVKRRIGLINEQAANARWGEDSDPEVNRPAWQD